MQFEPNNILVLISFINHNEKLIQENNPKLYMSVTYHIHLYIDTVLLKQKKQPVLDIIGFFFHMTDEYSGEGRGVQHQGSHLNMNAEKETCFLPLLWRLNPAEPVVGKSITLQRIKMSRAFPRINFKCINFKF